MILNCPSILVPSKLPARTVCFASGINSDQLRLQLDNLHKEAESTRAKANGARLRLMRLSEAAENLRQQAALTVRNGKENAARDLLFQKRKVMEAMEKSKDRIEMLDELSAKLNEVISVKETELIENVALDVNLGEDVQPSPVIFVSPKEEVQPGATSENAGFDEELKNGARSFTEVQSDHMLNDGEGSLYENVWNDIGMAENMRVISSYEDFLDRVDSQLKKIEGELVTLLKFSKLILESKENLENSKVQHAVGILEDVRHVRRRITGIKQS